MIRETHTRRQIKRRTDGLGRRPKSRGQRKHLGHRETGELTRRSGMKRGGEGTKGRRRAMGADSLHAAAPRPSMKPGAIPLRLMPKTKTNGKTRCASVWDSIGPETMIRPYEPLLSSCILLFFFLLQKLLLHVPSIWTHAHEHACTGLHANKARWLCGASTWEQAFPHDASVLFFLRSVHMHRHKQTYKHTVERRWGGQ